MNIYATYANKWIALLYIAFQRHAFLLKRAFGRLKAETFSCLLLQKKFFSPLRASACYELAFQR